ncbi:hypothetical protein EC957_008641 [Mortierella hygrophila]|uniref:Uncharacterized protein n=1 Tax=Mortierella hygrophila TaxID=979708 RepID=A0A9P6FB49_9FUNG|nr:hypothetical protein EC957_008641 [Mortierella hygrophila]
MSEPLSPPGRRQSQLPSARASAAEYLMSRKKPSAVAVAAGSGTMGIDSNNININDDYDNTHPLPAPPAPTRRGLDRHQAHKQEQEQEQDHEQEQDEPLSLQFASSTCRINNTTSHQQETEDLPDIPPPLPSKKTFYITHPSSYDKEINTATTTPSSSPRFLENFMSRHPKISRHRRRFAALLFIIGFLLLLLITLFAVLLSRRDDGSDGGLGGGGGGGGGLGQPGNEWGDGATATMEELRKHNAGISPAPINHSNEPGWTNAGQGEGTFYDPSIKNGAGDFQMGACEYPYINSAMDMIAALNKPDFGNFARASKSPACGQCLQVVGPNGTVTVQVVDMR